MQKSKFSFNFNTYTSSKKISKSNNIQNELNINKQESSGSDENEQDQKSSDAEILDIESPNYEPLYQKFSDKIMSDGENSESSTNDSNSVLNNMQDVSSQDSSEDGDTIQLPPGFPEALRLLEIKAHSNMPNKIIKSGIN
ncbi:unnamed protein product [Rhizophagus irregularis]|nr:unnamed protein product [Rhizophagus irregularis]